MSREKVVKTDKKFLTEMLLRVEAELGLNQPQMAGLIEVPIDTYRRWHQGRGWISAPALVRLINLYPTEVARAMGSYRKGSASERAFETCLAGISILAEHADAGNSAALALLNNLADRAMKAAGKISEIGIDGRRPRE